MRLDHWKHKKKITYQKMAEDMGCSVSAIRNLLTSRKNRVMSLARKVEIYTDGEVMLKDLVEDYMNYEIKQRNKDGTFTPCHISLKTEA